MAVVWKIAALLAAAWMGMFAAVCISAIWPRKAKASDCMIVLGAKIRPDGKLSNTLRYRCDRALKAWEAGVAWNIVVCGGQRIEEPSSEAAAMRAWLIRKGVLEERIFVDAQSSDTRQNLKYARRIMAEQGWRTAAIVTSDYHMQRALWLARDMGIPACGLTARSPRTIKGWLTARIRESVSWVLYGLKRLFD